MMNADGTGVSRLTNQPSTDSWPSWSPDGLKIAFGSRGKGLFSDIYVMNADGSNQRRLTDRPTAGAFTSWSPDGSKIAFLPSLGRDEQIFIMNPDGSNQTQITR